MRVCCPPFRTLLLALLAASYESVCAAANPVNHRLLQLQEASDTALVACGNVRTAAAALPMRAERRVRRDMHLACLQSFEQKNNTRTCVYASQV